MFEENGEKDGNYLMSHQLITYGSANFKNDAAILEIITPNNALRYRRNLNINDGTPTIKVRNNGSQIIKNIQFKYGVKGKNNLKYTWYGSLNFLDEQTITLPQLSIKNLDSSVTFYVVIDAVNNNLDEQHLNNYAESIWDLPSYFPNEIILSIKTNDNNRAKENSYIIIDNNSKIIKNRVEFPENTTFSDTLTLNPGIYTWIIKDQKQDGMIRHWWERNSNPDKVGINGEILFKNMVGDTIAAPTYDFADFYSLTFRVK
jgi:CRISPR/Cas system CMR subunit Cmr4 (Cas7 group RAMP superfamily)